MATRCRIGIKKSNGEVLSVYCHYDGYPSHTEKILETHYTDEAKVLELIQKGSFSCLEPDIDNIKFYGEKPEPEFSTIGFGMTAKRSKVDYAYLFKNNLWIRYKV